MVKASKRVRTPVNQPNIRLPTHAFHTILHLPSKGDYPKRKTSVVAMGSARTFDVFNVGVIFTVLNRPTNDNGTTNLIRFSVKLQNEATTGQEKRHNGILPTSMALNGSTPILFNTKLYSLLMDVASSQIQWNIQ